MKTIQALSACILLSSICGLSFAQTKPPSFSGSSSVLPSKAWIDKFGQNKNADWHKKIHTEIDLQNEDKSEQLTLDRESAPPDRDEYLGWKNGPQLKASGFFRLEKQDEKWWFVTPSGHLYYSIAIDCVAPESFTKLSQKNLRSYEWVPSKSEKFGQAYKADQLSFYVINLIRKWGDDWRSKFYLRAISRIKNWGFTGLGNWSDDKLHSANFPYVSMGPATWELKIPYIDGDIPDVYHPDFTSEVFRVAEKLKENQHDSCLIGYFLDNEMPWWNIPFDVLALDSTQPCKKYWLSKLKAQYGNIERLNSSWGTKAKNFDTLRWPGSKANKQAESDMLTFRRDFAERFYNAWYKAIKKADPNHLVLGSRIPYPMDDVALACARHTDVLSFNFYSVDFANQFDRYFELSGKPILIGEYDFDSLDEGLLKAFVPVKNQFERGKGYTFYTESAAAKSYIVGTHYFQYVDEPLTGRADGESSFNGFVNVADLPYQALVNAAKTTNSKIYEIHSGKTAPSKLHPVR